MNRRRIFIAITALSLVACVAVVAVAASTSRGGDPISRSADAADAPTGTMFTVDGDAVLSWVPADTPHARRRTTGLRCERSYSAAGRGLCMAPNRRQVTGYEAVIFDERFEVTEAIPVVGTPSRARVSPSGRYGAVTNFVTGHSYSDGSFSTWTAIIDLERGRIVFDLERLRTTDDGEVLDAPDLNYWGVTFAKDDDTFYATAASAGETWLIKGSISSRTARTIRSGVECPSLSPDGTRIAYKHAMADGGWQPRVLDLDTMEVQKLPEVDAFDDQIEWMDDDTLVFAVGRRRLVRTAADGSGRAVEYMRDAASPSTLRTEKVSS